MFPRATATGVENPVSDFIHIEQLEVFAQRQLGAKKFAMSVFVSAESVQS